MKTYKEIVNNPYPGSLRPSGLASNPKEAAFLSAIQAAGNLMRALEDQVLNRVNVHAALVRKVEEIRKLAIPDPVGPPSLNIPPGTWVAEPVEQTWIVYYGKGAIARVYAGAGNFGFSLEQIGKLLAASPALYRALLSIVEWADLLQRPTVDPGLLTIAHEALAQVEVKP